MICKNAATKIKTFIYEGCDVLYITFEVINL